MSDAEYDIKHPILAGKTWNLDDIVKFLGKTGRADIEEDNFGNVIIYADLHEDPYGNLREGSIFDE